MIVDEYSVKKMICWISDAWEQRELGEIAIEITRTDAHSAAPVMMITAGSGFIEQAKRYSTDNAGESLARYTLLRGGELAYNHGASKERPYGSCFDLKVNEARVPFVYHSFDVGNNNSDFLARILNEPKIDVQLRRLVSSGARMDGLLNVSFEAYMSVTVLLPAHHEQNEISEFFLSIDRLITLHQRKYEKLKNVKQALLEKMFPKNGSKFPEIRFAGFTDAWEQRKLGELGKTYSGLSGKSKEDFGHGEAEYLTYLNIFSNTIAISNDTGKIKRDDAQNKIRQGDVLFTTSSETPEEVGMASIWLHDRENIYLNSFSFGWRPFIVFDPYYLAYLLRSKGVRRSIVLLAQGISRYNISKNQMMRISIPIPKIKEQGQIGLFLKSLDCLITLHQRKGR